MSSVVRIPKNERLRVVDRGQSLVYKLASSVTSMEAGQLAALNTSGEAVVANGDTAGQTIIGVFGDSYGDVVGSASYPSGGSGKVTVFASFGRYLTLTYDTTVTYNEGEALYASATGFFTNDSNGATRTKVAVVTLAPTTPTAAVPTSIPEQLKGTMYGARKEDAVRVLPDGTKRNFLGFQLV